MAGLPITPDPAALLRGGEALNRSSLPGSRLAALLPVLPAADGGVASTGNTLVQNGGTVGGNRGPAGSLPGQYGSTRETLSLAAQTILYVLEGDSEAALPTAPVLRTVPAGTPSQVAAELRGALQQLVQQSGLFYESHLAEWVQGGRPLSALMAEPQARLASPPAPPPSAPNAAPAGPQGMPAPGTQTAVVTQPVLLLPAPSQPTQAAASDAAAPGEGTPSAPGSERDGRAAADAPVAKSSGRQLDPLPPRSPSELLAKQVAQAADAYESVAQGAAARRADALLDTAPLSSPSSSDQATPNRTENANPTPVHPVTEGLVRQQLELLASQQFRWNGEAWPGTPMEWEVARREGGEMSHDAAEQAWSTRLVLDLPKLGRIEARLTLNGTALEAAVSTGRGDTASRLNDTRSTFSGNLSANGLVLMRLTVDPGLPDAKGGRS